MGAKASGAPGDARSFSLGLSVVAYLLVLPGLLHTIEFDLFMILTVEVAVVLESLFYHRRLPDWNRNRRDAPVRSRAEDERLHAGAVALLGSALLTFLSLLALVCYDVLLAVIG